MSRNAIITEDWMEVQDIKSFHNLSSVNTDVCLSPGIGDTWNDSNIYWKVDLEHLTADLAPVPGMTGFRNTIGNV